MQKFEQRPHHKTIATEPTIVSETPRLASLMKQKVEFCSVRGGPPTPLTKL